MGALGGSPGPSMTPSHPRKSAEGSTQLRPQLPVLPRAVGEHHRASTSHCRVGPWCCFAAGCCPGGRGGCKAVGTAHRRTAAACAFAYCLPTGAWSAGLELRAPEAACDLQ